MKIGVLSDTHNHQSNIQKALAIFENHKPDILIFCGDATTVESIEWFCEYPIIYTFGNGDIATGEIKAFIKAYNPSNFSGFAYNGTLSGKKVGVTHGHLINHYDEMMNDGQFDYIFTGHTHVRMDKRIGRTRLINPGALGGTRKQSRSVVILDLDTDELIFEILE
ncbi:MAG: metallophosphoesterase family protein [Anaerolineaceae bacterium]|nr:metallophosphoesterase family protein [Anaerolineaceae bacterium]